MKENITNLDSYKTEKFKEISKAIEDKVSIFLDVNGITGAKIVWDQTSNIFDLSFSLCERDSNEVLLTGHNLHVDLVKYLSREEIPELAEYILNPYTKAGYISFIKE